MTQLPVTQLPVTQPTEALTFPLGPVFLLDTDANGLRVVPVTAGRFTGTGPCWVLPASPTSDEPGWSIRADGAIEVTVADEVTVRAHKPELVRHRARPHADLHGDAFVLDVPGGDELADAAAAFYWGTLQPCVVERTLAAEFPDSDGFVISTLADTYLGTYPDVDHEFQVKGRLAWGSATDTDVVRRMLELQLRMMREDPQGLWRDPCAVQPNGDREYHVRRNSLDLRENAVMFLVTGNVEILESAWLYVARTRDLDWLRRNLDDLVGAASCVVDQMDSTGRLWSDVYYEDQVIKDGRETMAASLAANSFELLADLLDLVGDDRAGHHRDVAGRLSRALRTPLPLGFWDAHNSRFVDWVDRNGGVHDHLHLLANVLPALFGQATTEQTGAVEKLVAAEFDEFQRFPTFLSARVGDYTDSEMGTAGPYDLSAAGRYWCWDAAYWRWRGRGDVLLDQLLAVAREAARDGYVMGERYDMDHVHYVDGSTWHGAAHYYEYPCVFSWVLFTEFLGVRADLEADLLVAPLVERGSVTLRQSAFRVAYEVSSDGFTITNLADHPRRIAVDPSTVVPGRERFVAEFAAGETVRVAR